MAAPSRGSELLSAYLAAKDCSQENLAEQLGVHQSTLSRWASGKQKPTLPWLLKLRDVLGISVDSWGESAAAEAAA